MRVGECRGLAGHRQQRRAVLFHHCFRKLGSIMNGAGCAPSAALSQCPALSVMTNSTSAAATVPGRAGGGAGPLRCSFASFHNPPDEVTGAITTADHCPLEVLWWRTGRSQPDA